MRADIVLFISGGLCAIVTCGLLRQLAPRDLWGNSCTGIKLALKGTVGLLATELHGLIAMVTNNNKSSNNEKKLWNNATW